MFFHGEGAVASHPFLGEGDPRGGGVPVCNRHQWEGGPKGWGTVISYPFQGGVGGRDKSPFLRRVGGP